MNQINNNQGCLYLVATPIGNLEDITFRAITVLKEVDLIAAEDTRHSRKLLTHFDIHTPLTSYHQHNEKEKGSILIEKLLAGTKIAVISDAGMPGISDPGYDLVVKAVEAGIAVTPIPGSSASLAALVVSGLPTGRFVFEGFLPRATKERKAALQRLQSEERTIVLYEAPHRLLSTLQDLQEALGDRRIAAVRELTKKYEEVVRGRISVVLGRFEERSPKGEFVLVVEGETAQPKEEIDLATLVQKVFRLESEGQERKLAIKSVAHEHNMQKRELYQAVLEALGRD